MKNLKKKTKRVLSLGLALLMAVSTMLVGDIQAKAETGTTYAPYYDVETEKVVGAPEVGTVLMPDDIIKAGDKLENKGTINLFVFPSKETLEDEDVSVCVQKCIDKGEEIRVGTVEDAEKGFIVGKIKKMRKHYTSTNEYGTDIYIYAYVAQEEEGTTYEPYYDAESGKVVGLPERGTILEAGDIIKAGNKVSENTAINILACNFVEETEDIGYVKSEYLLKGEEVDIADVKTYLCDTPNGYTLANVGYESYSSGETITIFLLAIDKPVKLENMEIELDWSKIDAEIGGTLSLDTFKEGFIKNEIINEESVGFYECIIVTKPDGSKEYEESFVINSEDIYSFELVYSLGKGYYFSANAEEDVTINDTLAKKTFHWNNYSEIWDDNVSITFEFTGAELVEKVNAATTPVVPPVEDDDDDKDPVVPPVEDDDDDKDPVVPPTDDEEEAKLELKSDGQAGPQNMKRRLSVNTFKNALGEIFEDYNVTLWTSVIEKGEEANAFATGTAEYVEGGLKAGLKVASGDTAYISVVKINDKTQADMIGKSFEKLEHYAQFENKYYLYSEGEYVVYISVPEAQSKAGLTLSFIKSYIDAYYEYAIAENDYTAKLENEAEIVEKVELSEVEKTYMELTGEELELILDFKEVGSEAVTEEQKAIVKELGDKKVGTFLEIDLTKKIGEYEAKVSETTGAVAITFELPAELKNTDEKVDRTYYVVRYHDGKVDILDATYDETTGIITFETDKFSSYAVVYEDVAVKEPVKAPGTGDTSNVAMYVMLLVCGAGILVASRKMNRI